MTHRPVRLPAIMGTLAFILRVLLIVALHPSPVIAGQAVVAVAANFLKPLEAMQPLFEQSSGHTLLVSSGATGQLYAQIKNGAPYDVFLSADEERPRLLEQQGAGVAGTRFTYALGRLTLWSADPARIKGDGAAALAASDYRALALANPDLAPFGMAARQTLQHLQLLERVQARIVLGENIGQTYSLIYTGNAEIGFIALSQLFEGGARTPGSRWDVPAGMHDPIVQQAILLTRGNDNAAARVFVEFLRGETARKLISGFGYGLE